MAVNAPVAVEGAGDPAADFNALRADVIALDGRGPGVVPTSGLWINPRDITVVGAQAGGWLNRLVLAPIHPINDMTLNRMGVRFYLGNTGCSVRMGVYKALAGKPTGPALADQSVDVSAATDGAEYYIDFTATVTAPLAFLAVALQGPSLGPMGAYIWGSPHIPEVVDHAGYSFNADEGGYYVNDAWQLNGVTGALPDLTGAAVTRSRYVYRTSARMA